MINQLSTNTSEDLALISRPNPQIIILSEHPPDLHLALMDLSFAASWGQIAIAMSEFRQAARFYRIIFSPLQPGKSPLPQVLLSENPRTNSLIKESKWHQGYIPLTVRRYPFKFFFSPTGKYEVFLDSSNRVNASSASLAITDSHGALTEAGRLAQQVSLEFATSYRDTVNLCQDWHRRQLFIPFGNHLRLCPQRFYREVHDFELIQWEPLAIAHWFSLSSAPPEVIKT
jgi:hypothetical protein